MSGQSPTWRLEKLVHPPALFGLLKGKNLWKRKRLLPPNIKVLFYSHITFDQAIKPSFDFYSIIFAQGILMIKIPCAASRISEVMDWGLKIAKKESCDLCSWKVFGTE